MLPTLSQIANPPTSSRGGRGADARSLFLVSASADRASETPEQSAATVEDIVRREPGFAAPGEMARRLRDEDDAALPNEVFVTALVLIGGLGLLLGATLAVIALLAGGHA